MPGPRRLPGSGMTGSSVPLGTLRTLVNGSAHEADRHVIGTWGGHVFRQQPCHRGIREAGSSARNAAAGRPVLRRPAKKKPLTAGTVVLPSQASSGFSPHIRACPTSWSHIHTKGSRCD